MHSPTSQPPRQDVDDRPLPVLVVGAGPAGLTLACSLRRADVAVRLIDKATEPPADRSRAMVLQPRTLELFDDLGIVDEALGAGLLIEDVNFYSPGGGVGTVHFGSRRLDSPYANLLGLPQD